MECSFDLILIPMERIECISKDRKRCSTTMYDTVKYRISLFECEWSHEVFFISP